MRRHLAFILTPAVILFGLLAFLAHNYTPMPGDKVVTSWIDGLESVFFDMLVRAVSFLGDTAPIVITVLVLVIILLYNHRRLEAVFTMVVPSLAGLFNYLMKLLIDRPRPGADLNDGGLSFPSGHTTYAVVFFGFLCYLTPRLIKQPVTARLVQVILLLLIILSGAARIKLGAHWPSDVFGSFIFGGILLLVAAAVYDYYAGKEKTDA
jgi:undecaprenyl-diphosphatase